MNWVWEESPVKGNERLLLLAIADCAADDGTNAYPSKQKLAEKTLLDLSTIRRIVNRLEQQGHLIVNRSTRRGRANIYTVPMTSADQAVDNNAEAVDSDVGNLAEVGAQRRGGNLPPRHDSQEKGAQRAPSGGMVPPQPSGTIIEPSTSAAGGAETTPVDTQPLDPVAAAVLSSLGSEWHLSDHDRRRLAPLIVDKVISGWPVNGLVAILSANPKGVVSAVAVLTSRLEDLPKPKRDATVPMPKPEWCGECDPDHRQRTNADGALYRCPQCHPLRNEPINERP